MAIPRAYKLGLIEGTVRRISGQAVFALPDHLSFDVRLELNQAINSAMGGSFSRSSIVRILRIHAAPFASLPIAPPMQIVATTAADFDRLLITISRQGRERVSLTARNS